MSLKDILLKSIILAHNNCDSIIDCLKYENHHDNIILLLYIYIYLKYKDCNDKF